MLHQSVGMPTGTGGYDTPFHIFPKDLSYWLFEVKMYRNQAMSDFGDCALFEVDMGSGARHWWEFPIVFECYFSEVFKEPILELVNVLFCWGEREFFGVCW